MTTVADASVLVAALVDSGHEGKWAESAIDAGRLAGPELVLAEATNILRRLEHAGEISPLEASTSHRSLLQLDVELYPFAPFAERVWALRGNLTSYDAWYVALAEALDCPLITLDRRLSRAAGPRCAIRVPPMQGRDANT
ncbi:MAG: type II toxin-antitoxin system VapC family toxin [Boseongicola sp. SB0670_bin_30]|nr:type II toxin-antitoxin system VapC family toxin [Boseongicola sp. SB0670_bin_30]